MTLQLLENVIPSLKQMRLNRVWCFVVVSNAFRNPTFAIGIAELGKPGYTPLSPKYGTSDDYKELANKLATINKFRLGYDEETTTAIYADTLTRQHNADGKLTIRMTREELAEVVAGLAKQDRDNNDRSVSLPLYEYLESLTHG